MLHKKRFLILLLGVCLVTIPEDRGYRSAENLAESRVPASAEALRTGPLLFAVVPEDVTIQSYFKFLKKLVAAYDTLVPYPLSEHLLVRANPWIMDTLENTDYYRRKLRGDTVLVQPKVVVLHRSDTLFFPDSLAATALLDKIAHTEIDVNIPEFRLRIVEYGKVLYSFPIRVGQNRVRYLAEVGREVDLRTKTGNGTVVRINQYPVFTNPVDGKRFTHTKRDDGVTTLMPQIPWTEVELNGTRYGQMVHPTTNPNTLEKPYSNGCIGLGEADAWRFYYHAPLGVRVTFRYDLQAIDATGDTILLPDIYKKGHKRQNIRAVIGVAP